jgi:hypothetical protein
MAPHYFSRARKFISRVPFSFSPISLVTVRTHKFHILCKTSHFLCTVRPTRSATPLSRSQLLHSSSRLRYPRSKRQKKPDSIMSKRSEADDPTVQHPSTKRAKQIDAANPYEELKQLLDGQDQASKTTKVLHWFRSKDLRIQDNRALYDASETAREAKVPLVCVYLNCPAEFQCLCKGK